MKLDIMDLKGNSLEKMEVPSGLLLESKEGSSVSQYIRSYLLNQRQGTSATKTRGMVSGGGRKPWKQKGTGRARQGSIRSPIWVHGGTAHGPQPKDWGVSVPRSLRKSVLQKALSQKFVANKVVLLDSLFIETPKTKEVLKALKKIGVEGKLIVVWTKRNDAFLKCASNIAGLTLAEAKLLNSYQIIDSDYLIMDKGSFEYFKGKFIK